VLMRGGPWLQVHVCSCGALVTGMCVLIHVGPCNWGPGYRYIGELQGMWCMNIGLVVAIRRERCGIVSFFLTYVDEVLSPFSVSELERDV
jgi:hypothetical protein